MKNNKKRNKKIIFTLTTIIGASTIFGTIGGLVSNQQNLVNNDNYISLNSNSDNDVGLYFTDRETQILNGGIFNIPNKENVFTSDFSSDDAKKWLNENKSSVFSNLPDGAEIIIEDGSYNNNSNGEPNLNGEITLKIDTTKYSNADGNPTPNPNPGYWNCTLKGFATPENQPTKFNTAFNSGVLSGVDTILPQFASDSSSESYTSDNQTVVNAIKTFLLNNNIVGLPPTSVGKITADDLDVSIQSDAYNNFNGEVTATIILKNNLGWTNGNIQPEISQTVTFSGLKKVQGTSYINSGTIAIDSSDSTYSKMSACTFAQNGATEFLNSSQEMKDKLFSNLPPNTQIMVKISSWNVEQGTVNLEVAPSQYYDLHDKGKFVKNDPNSAGYDKLTITGLNTDSTLLNTKVADTIPITGVDNILPQDATTDTNWPNVSAAILNASQNGDYIQNLTNGVSPSTLNSDNFEAKCNPSGNPDDKEVIGTDIFWDNSKGTITIRLVLKNNISWVNGTPEELQNFKVVISGFKTVQPTTQNQQTISVSNFNNTDWSQKLATDFDSSNINDFINQNKSSIFNNLPDEATLSIVGNPTYSNKDGTITIQVNTNQYYSDQNGTQYINGSMPNPITITLNGFINNNTDSSLFNTKVSNATLSGVNIIIPDSLTNPLQGATQEQINQYMTTIKNAIISANCISNPAQGQKFTADDIEITNIQPNNKDGQITCSVTINNSKAQTNGDPVASYTQDNVVFSGFSNQYQPTTINPNLNLPNVSNQLPISVTKDDIQNAINNNHDLKNQIGTNLPPNANITVDNVDTSDPSLSDNGQVKVTVSISPSYDANGNLTDTPIQQTIIVGGFKPSENVNTSITNPNFDLSKVNGVNNVLPTDVAGSNPSSNEVTQFTDAIKQYIVDNQNQIFSNLNPNTPLTKDDITIGNLTTPINKDGTVHLDSITINGSKVLVNGQPSQSNVTLDNNGEGFNLSGLKTQSPTIWNNFNTQSNIGNVTLAGANQIEVGSVTNDSLTSLINQSQSNKDQFLSNLPSDATISATIDSNGYDLANGTITCTVTASSSFDSNGNPAGSISNKYVIGQFIKNTSTTTVNNVDLTNQSNTIASEINASNQDAIINDIKNQLINSGAIQNTNPNATSPISPNDINVTITGSDNLTGKVKVDVTVNDPYYIENGVQTTQTTPTQIEVGGFKTLQPTNITDTNINNDSLNKNETPSSAANNPEFIDSIKQQVINSLSPNMFANGEIPSDINVEVLNSNDQDGTMQIKVSFSGQLVNADGTISSDGLFSKTFTISGFNKTSNSNSSNPWWMWVILSGFLIPLILIFILGAIEQKRKNKESKANKIN